MATTHRAHTMMVPRSGVALAEALVAMIVSTLIATAAATLFVAHSRFTTHAIDTAESIDALRIAAGLLAVEARALAADDIHAVSADSAAMRSFRGTGVTCAPGSSGGTVRYRGFRDPDPAKDSVLIVTGPLERSVPLTSVTVVTGVCPMSTGETLIQLGTGSDSLLMGDVALIFESGAYHVASNALRYRPPGGTRQPITADVLSAAATGFSLAHRPTSPGEPLALSLSIAPVARIRAARRQPAAAHDIRVALLNTSAPPDSTVPTP